MTSTPESPTTASAWAAAAAGELYRLPGCGHVARLRRPSLVALAAGPGIPNPILRLLALEGITERSSEAEKLSAYQKQALAFVQVAQLAFVEPRLVIDRAPDVAASEIGPEHLTDRDLIWIYYDLVGGSAASVVPFRLSLGAGVGGDAGGGTALPTVDAAGV